MFKVHLKIWLLYPFQYHGRVLEPISAVWRQGWLLSLQLIPGPYGGILGFGTLLKGASPVPWRCPCTSFNYQNNFHAFSARGLELRTLRYSAWPLKSELPPPSHLNISQSIKCDGSLNNFIPHFKPNLSVFLTGLWPITNKLLSQHSLALVMENRSITNVWSQRFIKEINTI